MKKVVSLFPYFLFILILLFPAGTILSACFGYTFELISVPAFSVSLAVLSVCAVVLDLIFKTPAEKKVPVFLLATLTPLSFINAVFYIFTCSQIWVIASVWITTACCLCLTVKIEPIWLKIAALAFSAVLILPLGFLSFLAFIFGNIGQDTVVQTLESPSGKYYAQVIDSNQGALGGDTHVDVYEKGGINGILFKIKKKPQNVYFGNWGEYKNMQIYWKDDECLMINSVEHKIE